MNLALDLNVIIQALSVAGILWGAKTLTRAAARLDTHEALDDLRFEYIDKKLTDHDERLDRIDRVA